MRLDYIIDYVEAALDDVNVHYTKSGVSLAINEANKILAITTLYYERTSNTWSASMSPALVNTGDLFISLPPDCIVPVYIRDTVTKKRVSPVKISTLELESRTWWRTYATSAEGYKYYSLWNPMGLLSYGSYHYNHYSLIVYPRIKSATLQLSMNYAAVPPTLTAVSDHSNIPEGFDLVLGHYAVFCGLMRRRAPVELAVNWLKQFLEGVGKVNEVVKSRYPRGRDFEPQPIEQLLDRTNLAFSRKDQNDRNRTRSRNR